MRSRPQKQIEQDVENAEEDIVVEDMTIAELAERLHCSVSNLIVEFLKKGVVAAKNQMVKKYGHMAHRQKEILYYNTLS